jgi:hypothetical protein
MSGKLTAMEGLTEIVGWLVDGFLVAAVIVGLWAVYVFADQILTMAILFFAIFGIIGLISMVIHYHWMRRSQ